jgi:predicted small lipoprotein YifL
MPRVIVLVSAVLLTASVLAGCGNKGQLVLPGQEPKKHKNSQPVPAQKAPDPKPADSGQQQKSDPPAQGDTGGH